MGRESGFIAAHTSLAQSDVNFCLIPENPFDLYGENGLLPLLKKRLSDRGHAVILVAEGAGQELLPKTGQTDASGNVRYNDIGIFRGFLEFRPDTERIPQPDSITTSGRRPSPLSGCGR